MKKVVTSKILVLLSALLVTGCASVPDSKEEDGVNYAISDSESEINEFVKNGLEDKNEFILSDKNGHHCICKLGKAEQKFNINAEVTNYEVATVSSVEAEPCPTMLNKEKIKEYFFDNDILEDTRSASFEERKKSEESTAMVGMQSTQVINYTNKDHTKLFNSNTDAGFFYFDDTLSAQYNRIDLEGGTTSNIDISDQYTMEMASEELTKTILDITGIDIIVTKSKSVSDNKGNGYYEFEFTSTVEGIGLAVNDREINTDNTIDSYGVAVMGANGIAKIEATNLLWRSTKENDKQDCLRLGEVLSLLEKYISDGKLTCNDKVVFSKCELVYLARTDDWKSAELVPVWRFYVPIEELVESDMGEIAMNNDIPTDICINAIDGTIEQMR